jgi:Domain of unknown function (DUF4124)
MLQFNISAACPLKRAIAVGTGLFVGGMLVASQAQAQVYKCVDSGGKTVYSQSPCPPGASSSVMGRKPPAKADAPASKPAAKADAQASKPAAKSFADQEMEFRKRQQEREEAEKKANDQLAESKRKQEDCRRAREQVAQYDMGGRISRMDDKGERYFLDENQVAQERAKAQASADQSCK